jgi:hypothetical protein
MNKNSFEKMKEIQGGAPLAVVLCVEAFIDAGMSVEGAMDYCGDIIKRTDT